NFKSACERFDKSTFDQNKEDGKPIGYLIAFSFGKGAIQEVARLKVDENVLISLVKVEDIVPIAKKPSLQIEAKDLGKDKKGSQEVQFVATAESNAGIEFYSWDFNYDTQTNSFKAEILLDKQGIQTYKFKAGIYHIAVKTVDNDGLEALAVLKLKINGVTHITN
ncbi:MAG TPA: hypothetical protein PKH93_09195, partial [Chitinophagales bacterium]|nr:hypothetical protein [Chitinophagales bacterium]